MGRRTCHEVGLVVHASWIACRGLIVTVATIGTVAQVAVVIVVMVITGQAMRPGRHGIEPPFAERLTAQQPPDRQPQRTP